MPKLFREFPVRRAFVMTDEQHEYVLARAKAKRKSFGEELRACIDAERKREMAEAKKGIHR